MQSFIPLVLALSALSALATAETVYTLHHRVNHATVSQLSYKPYGAIHVTDDDTVSFQPAPSLSEDLASFSDSIPDPDASLDNLYYQLALQRGDDAQSHWDFTSVKACHLPHVTSQTFVLHTENTKPFAMDYFVSPIPSDASCPKAPLRSKLALPPFTVFAESVRSLNTTVIFASPHTPPLPELRKPQPVTPTGQPVQPVPEKTFIQKYWMYIAVAFVALVLMGGEEEGPRRQAQA